MHVAGLREDIVSSSDQVLALLDAGEQHRHFGETRMNKNSSRSHTIFRMVVESRSRDANPADAGDFGAIRVSTLTLVDLAGSERIAKTGAEGQRMKEGAAINKSLLTLGTVINKLSEGVQAQGERQGVPCTLFAAAAAADRWSGGGAAAVCGVGLTAVLPHSAGGSARNSAAGCRLGADW